MKIVKATIKDLPAINKLNKKYFHEIRDFKRIIESPDDYFYVGISGKDVVAFSGFHLHHWNNSAFVIDIFVRPDLRRKGYGSQLIKKVIQRAKSQKVRTLIAEAPAANAVLEVYLQNGFRICGFNDRYYDNLGKEIAIFLSRDF